MRGRVTSFITSKKYGFIHGDDGKDYHFKFCDFVSALDIDKLCEQAPVEFTPQATPKGYSAKQCSIESTEGVFTYTTPETFKMSKSDCVKGWDIIEDGQWIAHGTSDDSPDLAKDSLKERAESLGANAILDLRYYRTKGKSGNYEYTIHNFKGRIATIAKKNCMGKLRIEDLEGLNDRARSYWQSKETELDEAYRTRKKFLLTSVIISGVIALISPPTGGLLFAVLLFFIIVIGTQDSKKGHWLEQVKPKLDGKISASYTEKSNLRGEW